MNFVPRGSFLLLLAASVALTACCDCDGSARKRQRAVRAPIANPQVTAPASHKMCVEHYKFKAGTDQYNRCIDSLSLIEAK